MIDGILRGGAPYIGYNHPELNQAVTDQLQKHVTYYVWWFYCHDPAIQLGKLLLQITPPSLDKFSMQTPGSVAVEVALKWQFSIDFALGNKTKPILSPRVRAIMVIHGMRCRSVTLSQGCTKFLVQVFTQSYFCSCTASYL